MNSKAMKKVIGLLLPILTLFILSACNNRVNRDLAKTAISNIRSVVEAAGLEAEGYSTADTFGYRGSPIYIKGTEQFVDVYVDFEKDYVEKTPVLRYNPRLKEVEGVKFLLPTAEQFLVIYRASSQDSYRNENNNHKDLAKIAYLEEMLKAK